MIRFLRKAIFRLRLRIAFHVMKDIEKSIHPREKRKQFWNDFLKNEDFRKFSFDHFYKALR